MQIYWYDLVLATCERIADGTGQIILVDTNPRKGYRRSSAGLYFGGIAIVDSPYFITIIKQAGKRRVR